MKQFSLRLLTLFVPKMFGSQKENGDAVSQVTNHEAAQAQEADERWRAESIEWARTRKYNTIKERGRALVETLFDENTRLLHMLDGDLPIDNFDDEEEHLYLRTQPRQFEMRTWKIMERRQIVLIMYLGSITNGTVKR